ncbi:MAG: hypothetical protein ACOYOE_02015 [Chlorobium sp.]
MTAFDFGVKVDPGLFDRGYNAINIQSYLQQAWQMFHENVGAFLGFTLTLFAVWLATLMFDAGSSLLFSSIAAPFYAGYSIVAFKLLLRQPFQFSDFFRGFNYFLPLFLASLASSILVGIGFILLLLPGIYLAVSYMFTTFLVIDYRMEFWQAMEISRNIISRNWFAFLLFALVLCFINLLGALAFGIGLLVTLPVTSCAVAIAYKEIVGLNASTW